MKIVSFKYLSSLSFGFVMSRKKTTVFSYEVFSELVLIHLFFFFSSPLKC